MKKDAVMGVVTNEGQANQIVAELREEGFSVDNISILATGREAQRELIIEEDTDVPETAAKGAGIGGVLGSGLGLLVGAASLAVPGVGPLLAAGPIAAALGGAAAGVVTGGVLGAMLGLGLSEDEAKQYEGKILDGNILVSVHTDDAEEMDHARVILERGGAQHLAYKGTPASIEAHS